jgi:hypothetical protein
MFESSELKWTGGDDPDDRGTRSLSRDELRDTLAVKDVGQWSTER